MFCFTDTQEASRKHRSSVKCRIWRLGCHGNLARCVRTSESQRGLLRQGSQEGRGGGRASQSCPAGVCQTSQPCQRCADSRSRPAHPEGNSSDPPRLTVAAAAATRPGRQTERQRTAAVPPLTTPPPLAGDACHRSACLITEPRPAPAAAQQYRPGEVFRLTSAVVPRARYRSRTAGERFEMRIERRNGGKEIRILRSDKRSEHMRLHLR